MKTYIVTGGAGFIGSHMARELIARGHGVIVLDNLSTGREQNIPRKADFIKIGLEKPKSYGLLKNLSCDAVLHLAGQSSGEASFLNPLYDLGSHVLSTFHLLSWCRKKSVRRFLYASSMSVYGDPQYLPVDESHPVCPKSFYAAGKSSAEAYIKLYQTMGINTTIFRLFSVYGPGQDLANKMQGMLSIYLAYMLEERSVIIKGSGERFRDFIYVKDVVDAWMKALNDPISLGKTYNLGSGVRTKVDDLIAKLKLCLKRKNYPVEYRNGTPGDQFGVVADIRRIKKELFWKPRISLRQGLEEMISFGKKGI